MIHKNRKNRRHMSFREAIRKQKIAKAVFGNDCYGSLHQYSKNKPLKATDKEPEKRTVSVSQKRLIEKARYELKEEY